jgi:hypothetical protein
LAYVTGLVNQELLLQNEYLVWSEYMNALNAYAVVILNASAFSPAAA